MELGSQPLYAKLNRVARDMDVNYIMEFRPFLRAFSMISLYGGEYKNKDDMI